jgi:glycosyltransferase involved in cell wall biosynthesis
MSNRLPLADPPTNGKSPNLTLESNRDRMDVHNQIERDQGRPSRPAVLLSSHRRNGQTNGGSVVSGNFSKIVAELFEGGVLEVFQDDPVGERSMEVGTFIVQRRSDLSMLWRLVVSGGLGRMRFRFSDGRTMAPKARSILILDGIGCTDVLSSTGKVFERSVVLHHNFEPDYFSDAHYDKPHRALLVRAAGRMQRRAMERASINLFLTRQDLQKAQGRYGTGVGASHVFGVYEPVRPFAPRPERRSGALRVMISGNFSVRKGYAGLIEMLTAAQERKDRLIRKIHFVVAGRNPTQEVRALADREIIEIVENPPSIDALVRDCDVYLNPNYTGSGIKVRNFDGLRNGLPVLCRIENAAGFDDLESPAFETFATTEEGLARLEGLDAGEYRSDRMRRHVWETYAERFASDRGVSRLRNLLGVD